MEYKERTSQHLNRSWAQPHVLDHNAFNHKKNTLVLEKYAYTY